MENNKQPMTAEQFLIDKTLDPNRVLRGHYLKNLLEEYKQQSSVQPGMSLEEIKENIDKIASDNIDAMQNKEFSKVKSISAWIQDYAQSCVAKAVEDCHDFYRQNKIT